MLQIDRNRAPETYITRGPDISPDPDRLTEYYYRAHLFWRGEDVDGTVEGFRFAIGDTSDPSAWSYTTRTDSVFRFPVDPLGSRTHTFYIRAVDELGKQDLSPDTLRFTAFTSHRPQVRLLFDLTRVNGVIYPFVHQNEPRPLDGEDTVRLFSSVTFVWTGSDVDGEVAGWTSQFDTDLEPVWHDRFDTTRTVENLESGTYELFVNAFDDAGAKSELPAKAKMRANFDSKTTINPESMVAKLPRPWIGPTDTLVIRPLDASGAAIDTIPSRAIVSASWTSVDPEGYMSHFLWSFGESQGINDFTDLDASTIEVRNDSLNLDGTVGLTDTGEGLWFFVKGVDIFGNVEEKPPITVIHVNYPPTVSFENEDEGWLPTGETHDFRFTANDSDGPSSPYPDHPADGLIFTYNFPELDGEQADSTIGPLNPNLWKVSRAFDASATNPPEVKRLVIQAFDESGTIRASAPDTVLFRVFESPEPGAGAAERRR
jgi:hypothetical protein